MMSFVNAPGLLVSESPLFTFSATRRACSIGIPYESTFSNVSTNEPCIATSVAIISARDL